MPRKDVVDKLLRNILPPSSPSHDTKNMFGSIWPVKDASGNDTNKPATYKVLNKVTPPTTSSHPSYDDDID